jgi:uncharacterized protein (TIGR02118 family)
MIKLTFCLRRSPTLSRAEFQTYWREHHAELVRRHAHTLRIRRYIQSHTFADEHLASVSEVRGGPDAFDGVAELWWDSVDDLLEVLTTPEGQAAGQELLRDEATFIDLANSPLFFTNERQII